MPSCESVNGVLLYSGMCSKMPPEARVTPYGTQVRSFRIGELEEEVNMTYQKKFRRVKSPDTSRLAASHTEDTDSVTDLGDLADRERALASAEEVFPCLGRVALRFKLATANNTIRVLSCV